jgi:hypothetical protein
MIHSGKLLLSRIFLLVHFINMVYNKRNQQQGGVLLPWKM